jgi:RNAse (barnase) inhibitor barstar
MNFLTMLNALDCYIGKIDGSKAKNYKDFFQSMAAAFEFPDYFGHNMNALWDCMTDLDWLDRRNYALVITNFSDLLKDEKSGERDSIMTFLEEIINDWAGVPNYEGEDEFRNKASFVVVIEQKSTPNESI